jgi:GNAT superfamily N-acetyltransferase
MGKADFICRMAKKSDALTLIAFNTALACETENKTLDTATIRAGVERLFDLPQYGFYIVAENSEGIGGSMLITYEWTDWRNGLFWWIQSVYVSPEFRRRGIYRALHSFARELAAKDKNVRGLRLYAEGENLLAHRAYRQLGMAETTYKFFEEIFARPS